MLLAALLVASISVQTTLQQSTEVPIVSTALGKIQGSILKSQYGADIYSFRGIPYAQPPLGELRFKAAQPVVESWSETLKATSDGLVCPQPGVQLLMSENCLFVNVYSGNLNGNAPVMVYIHGGANVLGSGHSLYEAGPQYLLDHDVVMVAFNYRLGALGFLSTGTPEALGNYGYLDQVLALKWVQANIQNFGGNRNLVTLFGMSAGSMAVSLHLVSPLSHGIFHRAIMMSGAATNHYAIDNQYWTRKLAREASCPMYNPKDVVECLRSLSWKTIVNICSEWEPYKFTNMKWNYEIDGNFLRVHPTEAVLRGIDYKRIPTLVGLTKNELDFSVFHQENNTGLLNDISMNFDLYAPELFLFNADANKKKSIKLQRLYFGNDTVITKKNLQNFGKIFSDGIIGHGVHRFVTHAQRHATLYYYHMSYVGERSLYVDAQGRPRGVGHADDLQYIMPSLWYGTQLKVNHPDMFMVDRMTKWFTTFAKNGVPEMDSGSTWTPTSPITEEIITLYNDKETYMGVEAYTERYELWDSLFPLSQSTANYLQCSFSVVLLLCVVMRFF